MNRPDRLNFDIDNVDISKIVQYVHRSRYVVIGSKWSVDLKYITYEYFEPAFLLFSEAAFYEVLKSIDADPYINRYDQGSYWTFMGLPMAAVKNKNGKTETWVEAV